MSENGGKTSGIITNLRANKEEIDMSRNCPLEIKFAQRHEKPHVIGKKTLEFCV